MYALLMASCKLRHYFMGHEITMPLSYPLHTLMHNKDAARRIGRWAAELAPFDLKFVGKTTIKSQVLADFVVEWISPLATPEPEADPRWTLYTDGLWCATRAALQPSWSRRRDRKSRAWPG